MKLISFAVISFLAITVSAYPGLGTPSQDLEESPSTSSQDLEGSQSTTTQSAQKPQSTTTQSAQEPQSTTIQSEQEYQSTTAQDLSENSQQSLQDQLEKLFEEYEEKRVEASKLQNIMDELETEMSEIVSRANTLEGLERTDLLQEFLAKHKSWSEPYTAWGILQRRMADIRKKYGDMVKEIASLNETQQ
ncbi:hypothetical protein BASA60_006852 [Batrachochytrium salamandrivorans]|nr:hypothetical protein BASA60_006852 [Batrachochytrium salamandrivorans]KAH9253797.1 hypothetical protein BASA81_008231 [Batrachochytrium salamandrivorans]KAH9273297.1 hypothetical protein BASA83_004294 [Batrachochytrium salamandrivorans]